MRVRSESCDEPAVFAAIAVTLRRFGRAYADPPEITTIWSRSSDDRANFATIRRILRRSARYCDDRGGRFGKPPRFATIGRALRQSAGFCDESAPIFRKSERFCDDLPSFTDNCRALRRFDEVFP
jgi:hypothetical protein